MRTQTIMDFLRKTRDCECSVYHSKQKTNGIEFALRVDELRLVLLGGGRYVGSAVEDVRCSSLFMMALHECAAC